jgi:hypothetical protein
MMWSAYNRRRRNRRKSPPLDVVIGWGLGGLFSLMLLVSLFGMAGAFE